VGAGLTYRNIRIILAPIFLLQVFLVYATRQILVFLFKQVVSTVEKAAEFSNYYLKRLNFLLLPHHKLNNSATHKNAPNVIYMRLELAT